MSCASLITLQSPFKYGYLDSNQGQLAPKASILPTELHPYIAESIVLETNTLLGYSLFSRQDYHLDSLLSILSFTNMSKNTYYCGERRSRPPSLLQLPQFSRLVPVPLSSLSNCHLHRCAQWTFLLDYVGLQDMWDLNPSTRQTVQCANHYTTYPI